MNAKNLYLYYRQKTVDSLSLQTLR